MGVSVVGLYGTNLLKNCNSSKRRAAWATTAANFRGAPETAPMLNLQDAMQAAHT